MRRSVLAAALAALVAFGDPAHADPKTTTLSVPGMFCPLCAPIVKKALSKVDGVLQCEVDSGRKEASVTFDDAKTSVESLMKATANAGFPSTVKR